MRKLQFILTFFILFATVTIAQTVADEDAIKKAAYDYAEGFFTADAARMGSAIYPDLNKVRPSANSLTGNITLGYSTYSGLIELTRAKSGILEEGKRQISFSILNVNDNVANARIFTSKFNDYLQLVKSDGQWKIINALWTGGSDSPLRLKDYNADSERGAIIKATQTYYDALYGGDARALELTAHQEINRVTINPIQETEKVRFTKQHYSSLLEASFSKALVIDEEKRNFEIKILDSFDGLAVVEMFTTFNWEYIQMFKGEAGWKILNTITRQNPNVSFNAALPALVGSPMLDFTLPAYHGGEFTLSKNKGKNVLLIFPRGAISGGWCTICQYQYYDYMMREKIEKLKKKYNMEIVFVLPFGKETTEQYVNGIPEALARVEMWKKPPENSTLRQKELSELARKMMPVKYEAKKGEVPTTLPILMDADKKVSKSLKLFTTNWDQTKAEQNIPTVFIINEKGNVAFKYFSQTTYDRVSLNYLLEFIEKM
jgi:peroxiredoxin